MVMVESLRRVRLIARLNCIRMFVLFCESSRNIFRLIIFTLVFCAARIVWVLSMVTLSRK